MNAFEDLIYEWGRIYWSYYPAALWRWEKEWDRHRRFR